MRDNNWLTAKRLFKFDLQGRFAEPCPNPYRTEENDILCHRTGVIKHIKEDAEMQRVYRQTQENEKPKDTSRSCKTSKSETEHPKAKEACELLEDGHMP
jgi:hypothetical protein